MSDLPPLGAVFWPEPGLPYLCEDACEWPPSPLPVLACEALWGLDEVAPLESDFPWLCSDLSLFELVLWLESDFASLLVFGPEDLDCFENESDDLCLPLWLDVCDWLASLFPCLLPDEGCDWLESGLDFFSWFRGFVSFFTLTFCAAPPVVLCFTSEPDSELVLRLCTPSRDACRWSFCGPPLAPPLWPEGCLSRP